MHHFIAISEFKQFTFWKRSIRVKIVDLLPCVTLKFDRWLWKTIGHLFSAISKPCASFHSCTCPASRVRKGRHNQGDTAWSVWEGHRTVEEDNTWKVGVAFSDGEICQRGWEGFCNPSEGQYQSWDLGGAIAEGCAKECREEMPIISSIMEGALNGNRKRHVLLCLEVHYWIDVFKYFNIHQNH